MLLSDLMSVRDGVTTARRAADSGGQGPGASVPPTVVYAGGFGLAGWLHAVDPLVLLAGGGPLVAVVGGMFVASGIALFLWSLRILFLARTGIMLQKPATALMKDGPYRWSRNPQYVAFTAIYVGAALVMNAVWPFLLLAPVLALVVYGVIDREERYLRSTFGSDYDLYCQEVRRWL
jgi:protein-S-isoprenylcysteine O-methyltransferase Ste14